MRESTMTFLKRDSGGVRELADGVGIALRSLLALGVFLGGGRWGTVLVLSLTVLTGGCSKSPDPSGDAAQPKGLGLHETGAGNSSIHPSPTNTRPGLQTDLVQPSIEAAIQLAAITNQFAIAQLAQAELIQKLQGRIEHLEQAEADRAGAVRTAEQTLSDHDKAHEEQLRTFLGRIKELEGKVGSLQAARVLPEITIPAEDGPTTRELDQKIRVVERKSELAAEAAEAKAKEAPKLSIGANGFAISSADTNFVLRLKGHIQLDSRSFFDDDPRSQGNDGFILRRARPIIEGTVFRDVDFQFVTDFGGSAVQIFDANLNYRYRPELQLKAGKFKGPVGFENLQSDATLAFNERSMVNDLVPSRNIGVQLWGDLYGGRLGYGLGVFNGAGDGRNPNTSDFSDDREFAARVSFQPFKNSGAKHLEGLGVGLGGTYTQVSSNATALPGTTGGTLPGYFTPGQQQFFAYNPLVGTVVADGPHWRVSPYVSYVEGPFGLLGEYAISHQGVLNNLSLRAAELEHTAWQVSAQWVLTGEPASFTGISPKRPFDPSNGAWGAWQLVGRFGQLDIDDRAFQSFANPATSASGATSWSVGVNWWLNRNLRIMTSFSQTSFAGGGQDRLSLAPPAPITLRNESVFFTRLQLAF